MQSSKCGHEENRLKVCAPCGTKIIFGKKASEFLINDRYENLIRKFVNEGFNLSDSRFPKGICGTCRLTLLEHENNNSKRPLPMMPNYIDIQLPKETRANDGVCNCYICLKGRFKGHRTIKTGKGHKRKFTVQIDTSNGLYGNSNVTQFQKSAEAQAKENTSVQMCKECFHEIGRGKQHICKSHVQARENVMQFINKLPDKQQDQILACVLKRRSSESTDDGNNDKHRNISLNLSTSGPKLRVTINPVEEKKIIFPTEKLDNYLTNTSASFNEMKKMTNLIRSSAGRQSVPANYMQHVSEKSRALENVYKDDVCEFDTDNLLKKERRPVVWADSTEILEAIIEHRGITGSVVNKVMADGGQGFFKISISIIPEEDMSDSEDSDSEYKDSGGKSNKRNLYSEGGTCAKKAKITSVQRLILLCVVPKIKETYENIKFLFQLTNINSIPFKFVSDFKILLIINGQQTAMSMYPCPYCYISLRDLKNYQEILADNHEEISETDSLKTSDYCLKLKTYGELNRDYEAFCNLGKKKKFAAQCHSTVNPPLFNEDDNMPVIQKCIVPELHLLLGFVNHLFWDGLVPLVGRDKALIWPTKLNLASKNYHGEHFEGNVCRTLLQTADSLMDSEIYEKVGVYSVIPFVAAFKAMNKVVSCCFSSKKVDPDLGKCVDELKKSFLSTGVSETLKIHVILEHLDHCLHFLNKRGFGKWSEQPGETIHGEFLKYWKRYEVTLIENPVYAKRMKRAVVEFSSQHI